ncbi:hypothetical protein GWK47_037123 [Chionoecetes opilio]|uniref:Uncharacterized protein n=1 Tax=Chionoecetes opilio TaxID=41210 RepID=A0A8J4YSS6_CHIOP|nr:hypothetical protein GWK47_037123 [Chionoecetes opilio]
MVTGATVNGVDPPEVAARRECEGNRDQYWRPRVTGRWAEGQNDTSTSMDGNERRWRRQTWGGKGRKVAGVEVVELDFPHIRGPFACPAWWTAVDVGRMVQPLPSAPPSRQAAGGGLPRSRWIGDFALRPAPTVLTESMGDASATFACLRVCRWGGLEVRAGVGGGGGWGVLITGVTLLEVARRRVRRDGGASCKGPEGVHAGLASTPRGASLAGVAVKDFVTVGVTSSRVPPHLIFKAPVTVLGDLWELYAEWGRPWSECSPAARHHSGSGSCGWRVVAGRELDWCFKIHQVPMLFLSAVI